MKHTREGIAPQGSECGRHGLGKPEAAHVFSVRQGSWYRGLLLKGGVVALSASVPPLAQPRAPQPDA